MSLLSFPHYAQIESREGGREGHADRKGGRDLSIDDDADGHVNVGIGVDVNVTYALGMAKHGDLGTLEKRGEVESRRKGQKED